jgi:hypothetical protein
MQPSTIDLPPAFNATTADLERVSDRYKFYSTGELVEPLLNGGWEITKPPKSSRGAWRA